MSARRSAAAALLAAVAVSGAAGAGAPPGGNYAVEARIAFAWAASGENVRTFDYAVILRAARQVSCDAPIIDFVVPPGAEVTSTQTRKPEGSLALCAGGVLPVVSPPTFGETAPRDISATVTLDASPIKGGKGGKGRLPLALLSLTGGDGDPATDDRCLDVGYPSAPIACRMTVQEQR